MRPYLESIGSNPAESRIVAASVRARLLNVAKAQGVDFNQVLVRFALERILYRMTQSQHADRFLLKGALLFTLWYDMPHRATRDADLLGFGASDLDSVAKPSATSPPSLWTTASHSIQPRSRSRKSARKRATAASA
jgi:hypothetical protein